MDLRNYFEKIRQIQASIAEPFVVISSLETADGGKAGTLTEVSRDLAARMIVEQRARLASAEETTGYYAHDAELRLRAQEQSAAARLQVNLITDSDLIALRGSKK